MDYCREEGAEGGGGGDVCVTLIDEVNTAGVSGDKDNDSIRGAGGGLKSPETFTGDVCFCVWSDFCVGKKKKEKIRVEANRNWKMWVFLACCIKVKLHFVIKAGISLLRGSNPLSPL